MTLFLPWSIWQGHMVLLQMTFAAVMLCGHGHDRGRGGGCSRNVVTVIGAEVSGDTLFTVGDLTRAHGFASSAFCGCHVVWSWS